MPVGIESLCSARAATPVHERDQLVVILGEQTHLFTKLRVIKMRLRAYPAHFVGFKFRSFPRGAGLAQPTCIALTPPYNAVWLSTQRYYLCAFKLYSNFTAHLQWQVAVEK